MLFLVHPENRLSGILKSWQVHGADATRPKQQGGTLCGGLMHSSRGDALCRR